MKRSISGVDAGEAKRQTERIVNSLVFRKAKRSQDFLRYLVDAALADLSQPVKEYTIASEVFGRDASYDPAIDATVRVEAGRLRSRLREYYSSEGREDLLLIELPKGAYRIVLAQRTEAGEQPADYAGLRHDDATTGAPGQTGSEWFEKVELPDKLLEAGPGASPRRADEDSRASFTRLQKDRADRWSGIRRLNLRYGLPLLTCGLVAGYAGWRLVRSQAAYAGVRSVAVLPLKNLSGDPGQDYFADGTTDELITKLARVPGLRVVSWNSVVQERDTKKPLQTIARELRADLLVEGSVSRSGNTVRINAQLIDAKDDGHLWANSFEAPLSDVLTLEKQAAEEIVRNARVGGRSDAVSVQARPAADIQPAARDAWLRGRNYFDKRQTQASAEQYQRAIDLSPGYASAYSGLAMALESEAFMGTAAPAKVFPQAVAAYERALQLDPDNGDALIARGCLEAAFLWRWSAAAEDLTRGIALSPTNSYGHMMLSVYLDSINRPDDAVRQMQQAVEIEPLSFYMARHYGSTLYYARRYDEALHQLEYAREMQPASAAVVDHWISDIYAKQEKYDDAIRYELLQLQEEHSGEETHRLLTIYRRSGWQAFWAAQVEESQHKTGDPCEDYGIGIAELRAGRHEEAMAALKRATAGHCYWMGMAAVDPTLDDLRGEPGFSDVLAGLHLPPASGQ